MKSKRERIEIFVARLMDYPPFASFQEATDGIARILLEVEDEFSGVASNPTTWLTDGRLYPPQEDKARPDPTREGVVEYKNRKHSTFIGGNGAVEIVLRKNGEYGPAIYRRAGVDGALLGENP